jgi:SAM-dependent methyltransferase
MIEHREHISRHLAEIEFNRAQWKRKPLLRQSYSEFYKKINGFIPKKIPGKVLELGSGIGKIKDTIPDCITSDIFPNPWLDRVENAYSISFNDNCLSAIILFDVWHHLEYPKIALHEFQRVLYPKGRLIIFEPAIGLLGLLIYGILHPEPVAITKVINWDCPRKFQHVDMPYYAAQGNCWRMFSKNTLPEEMSDWKIITIKKWSALRYILSGGFSRPSFILKDSEPFWAKIEQIIDIFPSFFATRMMVVLEKH